LHHQRLSRTSQYNEGSSFVRIEKGNVAREDGQTDPLAG